MPPLLRKILSSLAALGFAAGVPLFATSGAFTDATDPFPHSVVEGPATQD